MFTSPSSPASLRALTHLLPLRSPQPGCPTPTGPGLPAPTTCTQGPWSHPYLTHGCLTPTHYPPLGLHSASQAEASLAPGEPQTSAPCWVVSTGGCNKHHRALGPQASPLTPWSLGPRIQEHRAGSCRGLSPWGADAVSSQAQPLCLSLSSLPLRGSPVRLDEGPPWGPSSPSSPLQRRHLQKQ